MADEPAFVLLDLGDVLVSTSPDRWYAEFERLTNIPGELIRSRLERSGLVAAYEIGALDTQQFVSSAREATGLEVLPESVFAEGFSSVVSDLDTVLVPVVAVLARVGRLAFVSNTNPLHWNAVQERLCAADIFAPALLSFQLGCAKPDAHFFGAIPEAWGRNGVYIDDRPEYVAAAAVCGIAGRTHRNGADTAAFLADLLGT